MHDVIIIGAGPAGLTAALYAGRFRLSTLILEKLSCGGQIIMSSSIENFPGFPGGISTGELIERFSQQVRDVGVPIENDEVTEVLAGAKSKGAPSDCAPFVVKTQGASYETKSIIVATGAQPKRLGIEGEERLTGKGISYCATCDGPFFKEKEVVVVGGGDRAIEEALFLTAYARKVTVVHRRQELRAAKILQEKALSNPKIRFVLDSVIEGLSGEGKVEGAKVRNIKTGSVLDLVCQGVFVFVGIEPATVFLKNHLQLDAIGFIITDHTMKTSRDGIFACGDCRSKSLYQVINACGEGAVAADSAHKYILNLDK